jgi:hypothetical protein
MLSDDRKCLLARVSGDTCIGPMRPVTTSTKVNVVRMWSAVQTASNSETPTQLVCAAIRGARRPCRVSRGRNWSDSDRLAALIDCLGQG